MTLQAALARFFFYVFRESLENYENIQLRKLEFTKVNKKKLRRSQKLPAADFLKQYFAKTTSSQKIPGIQYLGKKKSSLFRVTRPCLV